MILFALRIVFGAGLAYGFIKVWQNAQTAPETGDLANAFYLALCVLLAMANAVVWTPFFGDSLSEPLTGVITKSTYVDRKNYLLRFVHWLDHRGLRRPALFFCLLEGIHHPDRPAAFVIGLKNARPGSRLERVYALEVFRFDNARHCLVAYEALRRQGVDPRPHHNAEINLLLVSLEREIKPPPEKVTVPPAPPAPPPRRDRRIKLFDLDEPEGARLISTGEAARLLGVSQQTLNRAVRRGRLQPTLTTPGGHRRFDSAELSVALYYEDTP